MRLFAWLRAVRSQRIWPRVVVAALLAVAGVAVSDVGWRSGEPRSSGQRRRRHQSCDQRTGRDGVSVGIGPGSGAVADGVFESESSGRVGNGGADAGHWAVGVAFAAAGRASARALLEQSNGPFAWGSGPEHCCQWKCALARSGWSEASRGSIGFGADHPWLGACSCSSAGGDYDP